MEAIWISLGGNAAFLVVVAFLGRKLLTLWLDKDFERFKDRVSSDSARALERTKAELQLAGNTEIERLKNDLALVAAEHSILLTRLQDRRADVIGDLYAKIAVAIRLTSSFVSPMQLVGEPSQTDKAVTARNAILAAQEKFDETQIWLTESCAKSVDELMIALRYAYNHFAVYLPYLDKPGATDQALERQHNAWIHSWESVSQTTVPAARRALETEMRSLLLPASRQAR